MATANAIKPRALPVHGMPDPQLARDTARVHNALTDLVRVVQFRDRDRICCHDISVTQCYALESLVRRGGLTLNELAAELFLDKSTASRVVDALERKGYVRRRAHPEDRRALQLALTSAGRRLYERIEQELLAEEARLLADFAPDVRQAMARLLQQLAAAASSRVDTSGGTCCRLD